MDRVTMLRFEKLKYFRSLPSCAWQSAHRASIRGLFGRLLATSGACCQSSFPATIDRKSTRLNSSHLGISYAVFCLKKKKKKKTYIYNKKKKKMIYKDSNTLSKH